VDNEFYIYIYLDPRKPGKYKYGSYEFDYEPFYVGKGHGRRLNRISGRSKYFKNKMNKIKESGLEPIIIKIRENLDEKESFVLESELINLIGRKDLDKGHLINFTDGGEGISGCIRNEETRKKQSEKMKGKYKGKSNPMFGVKGKNNPFYGKHHSEETKRRQSERMKGEILRKKRERNNQKK